MKHFSCSNEKFCTAPSGSLRNFFKLSLAYTDHNLYKYMSIRILGFKQYLPIVETPGIMFSGSSVKIKVIKIFKVYFFTTLL